MSHSAVDPATEAQRTLLLVDDEPDILVALEDLFDGLYRVLSATSGPAGLELLRANPGVEVVISDQRMPGMTGDRFLAEARGVAPIEGVLLTGYADLGAVVSAVNLGGISGYATKPWEPLALKAMVAAAFARSGLRRALDVERTLLRGLLDSAPGAIAFKDRQGRVVRAAPDRPLVSSDPEAAAVEAEAWAEGREARAVFERQDSDGASRWTEIRATPLAADGETPSHLLVIERDVTQERLTESRLRQADKLQALGTLAGGVAHDFNNLLTAILGNLDLAARKLTDENLRRYIDSAAMAARRGATLTQRLLGFSRKQEAEAAVVDVNSLLRGMDDLFVRSLGPAISLHWSLAEHLWPAELETDQLELAVLNLCINARDAMPDGGVIGLTTAGVSYAPGETPEGLPPGDYVQVQVSDSGHGMDRDLLGRVFEPFFTTKDLGKGTGLGLSMVYGFVQRAGGAVTIESTPGEGTTVTLLLPRAKAEAPKDAAQAPAAPGRAESLRVLLVDDDDAVRDVAAAYLRDLGHQVTVARRVDEALQVLDTNADWDLLVVDFAMPGANGLDLVRQTRQRRPDLPALVISGHAASDCSPQGVPVLRKPFDQQGLATAIAEAAAPGPRRNPG